MKHIKVPIRRLTKFSTRRIAMNKASKARRLMTLCMSLLLVIAGSAITAPTASANDVTATVFDTPDVRYVNVRDGAGPEYNWIGRIDAGQTVTLECFDWMYGGDDIKGPYSSSRIWYKIKGYDNGWVSDAYLNTGSNDPVAPQCDIPRPVSGRLISLDDTSTTTYEKLFLHYLFGNGETIVLPWEFFADPHFKEKAREVPVGGKGSYTAEQDRDGQELALSLHKFSFIRTSPGCYVVYDFYDFDPKDPDPIFVALSYAPAAGAHPFAIRSSGCDI